ncbi:MAG: ribosome maturation factor RimM [Myxococcota bacterium]
MRLPELGVLPDEVELGHVTGVFGFRGEVKVYLHNPASTLLAEPTPIVLVAPDERRFAATASTRPGAGQRILARFAEVGDEAGATALKGWRLVIARSALPPLEDDDEYYVWQLEGARIRIDGADVGRVVGVQDSGPHDVLEILVDEGVREGDRTAFVPVLKEFVVGMDLDAQVIELAPGALDEL